MITRLAFRVFAKDTIKALLDAESDHKDRRELALELGDLCYAAAGFRRTPAGTRMPLPLGGSSAPSEDPQPLARSRTPAPGSDFEWSRQQASKVSVEQVQALADAAEQREAEERPTDPAPDYRLKHPLTEPVVSNSHPGKERE